MRLARWLAGVALAFVLGCAGGGSDKPIPPVDQQDVPGPPASKNTDVAAWGKTQGCLSESAAPWFLNNSREARTSQDLFISAESRNVLFGESLDRILYRVCSSKDSALVRVKLRVRNIDIKEHVLGPQTCIDVHAFDALVVRLENTKVAVSGEEMRTAAGTYCAQPTGGR